MIKSKYLSTIRVLLLGVLLTGLGTSTHSQKIIRIEGKVQFQNTGFFQRYNYVWLKKGLTGSDKAVDSVKINADGTYSLNLKVNKPGFYRLDILKWQSLTFWADESIKLSSRGYDTAQVKAKNSGFINIETNSKVNKFINILNFRQNQDQIFLNDLVLESFEAQKKRSQDSTWYTYLRSHNLYKKFAEQTELNLRFTYNNAVDIPSKLYVLSLLNRPQNASYVQSELSKLLLQKADLEDAIAMKKEIAASLATLRKTQPGSPIPDIIYPDPEGKLLDIKSLRGKYLIVDFWASWCGPCRKSIPKLKQLYETYHEKGFDILSISIDTDKEAWKRAMAEEAMPWHQALAPNKETTMTEFNIQGVPTLFVVAPTGQIIEKFTGYSARIEELLKAKLSK